MVCAAALATSPPGAATLAAPATQPTDAAPLVAVDLSDARATTLADVHLLSARNETVGLAVHLTPPNKDRARKKLSLRIGPLKTDSGTTIDASVVTPYQVVDMPAETNRAEYVRHTGQPTSQARLPGALIPLQRDKDGRVPMAQIRDGGRLDKPGDKEQGIAETLTFWFDLHIPAEAPAGEYSTTVELLEKGLFGDNVVASLPVKVAVDDFALSDDRHLRMVSPVAWETLYKHWPKEFEAITPRLLNRDEPHHAGAIRVMDQIVRTAQLNRVQVVFDRVQPTVKWPAGAPPQVDWADFDTVVGPWMTGEAFADRVPYGYWPLPKAESLERYDQPSRMEYWQAAATHFDQKEWLFDSTVLLDRPAGNIPADRARREVTAEAAAITRAHSKVRVTTPVPEATLDVSERPAEGRVDLANAARVIAWGPGLVYAPRQAEWPKGFDEPGRFLAVGQASPTPYVGVGETERDVRQWAWLAFLQNAGMVLWNEALPAEERPDVPAAAGEQVWLYPGSWFGVDGPVESLQIKWARRAAQDYEYLWLARQRGEMVSPEIVASLLSKPVEVRVGQAADPAYALVSGTADQAAWSEARRLVAKAIGLTAAGQTPDERKAEELRLEAVRWTNTQGKPTAMARDVRWAPTKTADDGHWLNVKLGVDVYTPTTDAAEKNSMEWATVPPGWQVNPRPTTVPTLEANRVRRVEMEGRFDLDRAGAATTGEGRVEFVSGYNGLRSATRFVLPVVTSERREGNVTLDGELGDWNKLDAVQDGALVKMLDQPGARQEELSRAGTASAVYTGWGEDSFYVAFRVGGVSADLKSARNFVEYQQRRAWGEDLCELLVQGVYEGGATGPTLHVVCKPTGQWVERKSIGETEWTASAGTVLYAGKIDGDNWRGEVSVPWKLIDDAKFGRPKFLRFNFVQHKAANGESSSWAGPVDYGRDEGVMGVIVLRDKGR